MVWFKESLSAIEAQELRDLDDEREMLEHIILFLEQKGAEEARIAQDLAQLAGQTSPDARKRLVGDIHEVLGFLSRLQRQLGGNIKHDELEGLYAQWEAVLSAIQKQSWSTAQVQAEAKRLFDDLFADMDVIKGLLTARHERLLHFIAETRTHSASLPGRDEPSVVTNDDSVRGL